MSSFSLDLTAMRRSMAAATKAAKGEVRRARAAHNGALLEGAQLAMDLILKGIWVDTGDLRDSNYVSDPDNRRGVARAQALLGFLAPYTALVEFTHPTNPYHISRTVAHNLRRIDQHVATWVAKLYKGRQTTLDVPRRHPRVGKFENRRANRKARR